jgi:hypothetical protein
MLSEASLHECVGYMMGSIRKICEDFGPRPPGSAGERRCQEFLRDELTDAGFSPVIEAFPVSQTAFMTAPVIAGWLAILSVPCYWHDPRLSLALLLIAGLVFVAEVISYRHILTPFFPRHTSHNLHAVLAPSGTVRRRIILAGHADGAFEWRYQQLFPHLFMHFGQLAVLSITYVLATTFATVLSCGSHAPTEGFWWCVGVSQFVALPGLFVAATFTRFGVVAPGAVDNLSGALVSVGLARQFKQVGVAPENTEIIFMVTGSEEAGLCGARAFMECHSKEWGDVETVFVALESFRDLEHLMVYDRDLNGSVHHHTGLCALLQNAMRHCGLVRKFGTVRVGASDAAALTRAGLPAAMLCGMDPKPAHYYHCRRDSWEILDEQCLFKTVQVVAAALEDYDRNGLPAAGQG